MHFPGIGPAEHPPGTADTMAPGKDTAYLQETIGDALGRGVAATVTAQPTDPVEYLGQWLLR